MIMLRFFYAPAQISGYRNPENLYFIVLKGYSDCPSAIIADSDCAVFPSADRALFRKIWK